MVRNVFRGGVTCGTGTKWLIVKVCSDASLGRCYRHHVIFNVVIGTSRLGVTDTVPETVTRMFVNFHR